MHKACCLISLLSMLAIIVGRATGEEVPRGDRTAVDRGQPCVNVRDYGARGDGVTDDTDAIQMAVLDAASKPLPLRGRVCVPPGIYMIKADAPVDDFSCPDPPDGRAAQPCGVALLSGTRFHMDPGATLRAFPTAQGVYRVLRVWQHDDVTITGGTLLGERDEHISACSPGTRCWNNSICPESGPERGMCPLGEQGFGIDVRNSSNIRIEHVTAANFWGDGFLIHGLELGPGAPNNENVSVTRSVASRNRRNGLSLLSCKGCRVVDSTFSDTGGNPQGPEAGIDLEPSGTYAVQDSLITRCTSINNFYGIQLVGAESTAANEVTRNVIAGNRVSRNEWHGILIVRALDNRVMNNRVTRNGRRGIWVGTQSSGNLVEENLVVGNAEEGISVNGEDPDPEDSSKWPTRNVIAGNRVSRNEEHGIRISQALDNQVMNNRVTRNGRRGIWVGDQSSGNLVEENLVVGNAEEGISVAGQETEIVRNIAVDNPTDLVDAHEDCDTNRWQQNVFRTSRAGATGHPACIQ
jgi:parallel beta-helix repeat protein